MTFRMFDFYVNTEEECFVFCLKCHVSNDSSVTTKMHFANSCFPPSHMVANESINPVLVKFK